MNMSAQKTNTIAHPYLIIKAAIIVAVLLCNHIADAQEYNNWLLPNGVIPNFNATTTTETITVCPSATKKYSVESPEPGYTYHWNVTGGTLSGSIGSEVSVIWDETEGEGTISVYAEQTESGCKSDITYLKVHRQKAPSAAFDNAQVCYGEPLKISLSGTAPYEIFYTLDGDEKSATTSESTYTLPNTPGKYTITKVKDKNCEWLPSTGNTSEISPQLHKLHIVKE